MINVIESVLFGQINAELVADLNEGGVPAIGLSGAKNNLLHCKQASAELGQVGVVEEVNAEFVNALLAPEKNVVPVIAPIGIGEDGELFNINADWAAAKIASRLKAKKLIFLTDQNGILDQNKKLIEHTDYVQLQQLIDNGTVSGGMYTKVQTVVDALNHGVAQVRILRGTQAYDGLWSDFVGTMCRGDVGTMSKSAQASEGHYV
jgi:acetylglutamate kinase